MSKIRMLSIFHSIFHSTILWARIHTFKIQFTLFMNNIHILIYLTKELREPYFQISIQILDIQWQKLCFLFNNSPLVFHVCTIASHVYSVHNSVTIHNGLIFSTLNTFHNCIISYFTEYSILGQWLGNIAPWCCAIVKLEMNTIHT